MEGREERQKLWPRWVRPRLPMEGQWLSKGRLLKRDLHVVMRINPNSWLSPIQDTVWERVLSLQRMYIS